MLIIARELRDGETVVIAPHGDLNSQSVTDFDEALHHFTDRHGPHLIIDCSHVKMLGSQGVGVLMRHSKALAERGDQLHLVTANPNIEQVLRITSFDQTLKVHATVEDALGFLHPVTTPGTQPGSR